MRTRRGQEGGGEPRVSSSRPPQSHAEARAPHVIRRALWPTRTAGNWCGRWAHAGGSGRWLAGERGSGCWRAMALPSPQLDLFPAPPPRAPPHKGGAPGVGLSLPNGQSGGRDGGSDGCVAQQSVLSPVVPRRRRVRLTARCVVCNAHSFIGRGVGGHNNPGSTAQHRGAARASPGMMPGEPVVSSPAGGSADGTAAAAPAAAAAAAAAPGPDLARA